MDFIASYQDSDDEQTNVNNNNNNDTNKALNQSSQNSEKTNNKNNNNNNEKDKSSDYESTTKTPTSKAINIAPNVSTAIQKYDYLDPGSKQLTYNLRYSKLQQPVAGPEHPHQPSDLPDRNHLTGYLEEYNMNQFTFEEQFQTFNNYGYAVLGNNQVIGDAGKAQQMGHATVHSKKQVNKNNKNKKRRRGGKPGSEHFQGPWAPFEDELPPGEEIEDDLGVVQEETEEPDAKKRRIEAEEEEEEEKETEEEEEEEEREKEKRKRKMFEGRAEFHREERYDYLGRPWLTPPSHLRPYTEHECFIPKKHVHTWQGHAKGKGVTAIRFFPGYGHLLLSASQDSTCKIWDVTSDYDCVQTYKGHMKPVRDIRFQSDGLRFASAGYDKNVRLWDTETGKVVITLNNGRIPYCVRIHPNEPNEVLVGTHDKKIIQYDIRTGEQVQVYDQHLGPVNTITFLDNGRRFVTSSDDKTLRVWEYGIPVVIKYIAEPHMHSMPSIAVHPNNKWFAAQSLDNQILVYGARDKFRLNSKKRFVGHMVAGYACQVNFSPDGRFLMSGDSEGRVFFWDWKNCRKIKAIKAHEGVAIGCEWHPLEPSKVATCGWDGTIKYWD